MAEPDGKPSPAAPLPTPDEQPGAASAAALNVPFESGMRPLPWPPWGGRHGSRRIAAALLSLWVLSLFLALALQTLGLHPTRTLSVLPLSSLASQAPWTIAVLWALYGDFGYGMVLLLICRMLAPQSFPYGAWFSDPLGLVVFTILQRTLSFDPRLRSLAAAGLFVFAAFCAADADSISSLLVGDQSLLLEWEQDWLVRLVQDVVITAPLAFLLGPLIEKRKRLAFGNLPLARSSGTQQLTGMLAGLCCLIAFCITWTLAAAMPLTQAITETASGQAREVLEHAHRIAALQYGALVAMLLGTVCGGASLVVLLLRRYREELRQEVSRGTEALRRRHLQLATLQQVTEAASRSLDPAAVHHEMAQTMARLTDAAQVAVYVSDDVTHLRLIHQVSVRPAQFEHGARLPVEGSLTGQCFRSRSILSVPNNLPLYIQPEQLREQFQSNHLEAFLAVPILGENSALGVVSLSFDTAFAPDEEEQRLFRLIGRAIGAALERAETHAKARRYADELGGLYRFSQQLAVESDERRLLGIAAAAARDLLAAKSAAILVVSGETEPVVIACVAFEGDSSGCPGVRELTFSINEAGLIGEAIREGRTLIAGGRPHLDTRHVLAKGWTTHNALVVPLPSATPEHGVAGAIVLTLNPAAVIGLEESGLAEEIARQTSAGLRRARLIAQTRQQAAELKLLEQVGRLLSQRLNIANTLEQLVQNVDKFVAAKWASVFVYDPDTESLQMEATTFTHPGAKSISIPLTTSALVVSCFKEGRTLHAPDTLHDPRCNEDLNRLYGTAAGVCVPLGPSAQRFGVLMVNNPTPGSFTHDDLRRLEQLAQLASAAIERARLYEEACQRADELILLNEVGHLLVENPALENTLQHIAELVCRNFEGAGAGFLLLSKKRDTLIARGVSGLHARELKRARVRLNLNDITTVAFRQNQPQVVENAVTDARVHPIVFRRLPDLVSGAVVPMSGTEGPIGVLAVWKDRPHRFHPRDLQCLGAVGRLAAAAVGRDELGQALRASEERLKEVVDGLHALVFSIDVRGSILSFNAAAERISGFNREAVLGRGLAEIVSPKRPERTRLQAFITHAFQELDCREELILNWTAREGAERKIRMSASFLRDPEGKVTGMVCLGVDITEQVLLEAQLLQAQKMESVGALAGGMAHDFNNLLGGIIGQCAIARAQDSRDQTLVSCLAKIESAAQRGADLTSKLMAFARKSVLQPRPVDIGALITETAELLSGSLPRNIEIITNIAPGLPWVHGDPTQLQQVLLNLCVNARDAMPDGGTLRLTASPVGTTSASSSQIISFPAGVLVEVADTGAGMSEDVQQRLFEPFFTTKELGKGTGLGLSVVFGIVHSHGGQISVQSQVGKGTRFVIRLPIVPPTRAGRPRVKATRPGETSAQTKALQVPSALQRAVVFAGNENLLLVDDDSMLRETTRQLLSNLGYRVRTAAGGLDALKLLESADGFRPAAILLDVVMPGLAGPALFAELRKRLPDVPIVLMSGYSADKTVTDMLEAGAAELVQKPFAMEVLAGAIRRAVEQVKNK